MGITVDRCATVRSSNSGSIPTCVGRTLGLLRRRVDSAVHPHVRGEHPAWPWQNRCGRRSIPTCVGSMSLALIVNWSGIRGPSPRAWGASVLGSGRASTRGPSPRAWGAYCRLPGGASSTGGPSPRAWGACSVEPGQRPNACRSIPTCVGSIKLGVHSHLPSPGPSPRAWGA